MVYFTEKLQRNWSLKLKHTSGWSFHATRRGNLNFLSNFLATDIEKVEDLWQSSVSVSAPRLYPFLPVTVQVKQMIGFSQHYD